MRVEPLPRYSFNPFSLPLTDALFLFLCPDTYIHISNKKRHATAIASRRPVLHDQPAASPLIFPPSSLLFPGIVQRIYKTRKNTHIHVQERKEGKKKTGHIFCILFIYFFLFHSASSRKNDGTVR